MARTAGVAASSIWSTRAVHAAKEQSMKGPMVCVFSKHLQFLDYEELASTCKALNLDGVDLTVRNGGHVLPENVARDLPAAVEAIRAQGLEVPMITTRLNDGADPDARPILEAASKLGIPYFRIDGLRYDRTGDPFAKIPEFTKMLASLTKIAENLSMTAGYHNHSGHRNMAGPLWDLHHILHETDSPHLGSNFDVGHAKIEGGLGAWETNARLLAPHVKMMAAKDFVWEDGRPRWVPLGEGHVDLTGFLRIMRGSAFAGPISIHVEYDLDSDEAMIADIGKAAETLRAALREADYE
jgi:sugar phosphate isomerase/epimerase